ncbi:MAG: sigma-70 family RNA polymerase sigma factor [Polyangiaceae bacterium]
MSARDSGFFTTEAMEANYGTETELVAGLLADEPLAWRAFEKRYGSLIERCIAKILRRFNRIVSEEDVAEVRANVYLQLLSSGRNKLRSWSPDMGSRLSTWLGMIAIHAAYDHLRSVRREPHKEDIAAAFELACTTPDPYQQTASRQNLDRTRKAIEAFSDKDQVFAALYFGEGLEPEEIAEQMNISVKTVYTKKHKIQGRLLAAFEGFDGAAMHAA